MKHKGRVIVFLLAAGMCVCVGDINTLAAGPDEEKKRYRPA